MKHIVRIVEDETGNVVREFDVTGKTERQIDKMINGIYINLDVERFSVVEEEQP